MKKRECFALFIISVLCLLSCSNKRNEIQNKKDLLMHQRGRDGYAYIKLVEEKKLQAIKDFENSLSLEEKISQLFIENLEGNKKFYPVEKLSAVSTVTQASDNDSPLIPGGFLYFGFNIADTPEQIIAFNSSIKNYCYENNKIPPFMAVDQEGGFVNRLRDISGILPSCERVAKKLSVEKASQLYKLQAIQMDMLGFNMNLAPVIEVCTNENALFLNQRSFGNLEQVLAYGAACINSYEKNNIATVVKHFPGNTNTDPHTGLPEIDLSDEMLEQYLKPFKELVKENPTGVLMSHARVKSVDEKTPSCLSEIWVTQILRNLYKYDGIIFSDDIFMGALADNGYSPQKAVIMAIDAGIDCIMISEKRISRPGKVLYKKALEDEGFYEKINKAVHRMIQFKMKNGLLELIDDENGGYKISPVKDKLTQEERLQRFYSARELNNNLYKENF